MGRVVSAACLVMVLISSCDWTPERDNPYDPLSGLKNDYNFAPEILDLRVMSHCESSPDNDFCYAELHCIATDRNDPSLLIDVYAEDQFVGTMSYDFVDSRYEINHLDRDDLPTNLPLSFRVIARDDSGLTAEDSVFIVRWYDFDYPILSRPARQTFPRDTVYESDRTFSWLPTTPGEAVSLSIQIQRQSLIPVWDTSGISPADTTIWIPYEFRDVGQNPSHWYTWNLTQYNELGNSATSQKGYFNFKDDTPPPETD